ncbi:succinyl-diaminopimelate desuccinylase [Amylibacter sp.]|jgi:succinyl-diaminopimelate desuccinylase|nr:succinyl-diaminopimelate desuccinylase [Amylibacter sp.]MDA9287339.1 succinyl-diaminopimelate desuccinylase [Amylibacter sp.]MDA9779682.1 succinyl-diaminopimelate desuccinylase [Amylibacter sp.]MDB2517705.1 succinyl-diaminopimelate desuccinylase [Amylibacter sp.]MDB3965791.1 succinyl-diaminopimelate desuccinylase [Amylibacter sp.]
MNIDPVNLTADLIRCKSITPKEAGALVLLEALLSKAGFECNRVDRGLVSNLFARWGSGRTLGFNGHTDVVPVGSINDWSVDPFGAEIKDGFLYGRGSTDMKSGVAAFAAAAIDFVQNSPPDGSIVLAITGDEEGQAVDGTVALLDWMNENNEIINHCIVGEPTCPENIGEMMKIGRRGSMTAYFTIRGVQGHSAYPHRANNPLPIMAKLICDLTSFELDQGSKHFDPSTLAVTTIDTGNLANNVIPSETKATVNIRFNDLHTSKKLSIWLDKVTKRIASENDVEINTEIQVSGESFITALGDFSDLISNSVHLETGIYPEASTSGGTSDARFIKDHCPVVEFGLVGKTMHQIDERVSIDQVYKLKAIYFNIIKNYFA